MKEHKQKILEHICYTELVYGRINKKLNTDYSKNEIENILLKIIKTTDLEFFKKKGKNFYIYNKKDNIRITVNSHTYRIITVDKLSKTNNI